MTERQRDKTAGDQKYTTAGDQRDTTTDDQRHTTTDNPRVRLTCSKDDGKGNCVAAMRTDGTEVVVNGDGLKSGAPMSCVDRGNVVDCEPAS